MSEDQANDWGWEATGSEEDGEDDSTTIATDDNIVKESEINKSESEQTIPSSVSSDKVQAPKFSDPKLAAMSIGSQSLQKGITSSPSFQELERAIGATLAMSLNVADQDHQQQSNKNVGFNITQQKLQQQRIKQQLHHRQQQPQYPSAYTARHGLGQYPPPHSIATQDFSARNELGLFINESESRAIILFHSPLVSPIAVRDACQKCGVLYYIRPEFHGKGVTLLSYFDLRSAIHAHGSVVEELGSGAEASAYYSVMLHAANNNSEEFRLVARNLPLGHPEAEVQSIFSRYGQLRSIQRIFGSSEEDEKGKPLDPESESSPTTGTEESAFRIEYFNIQDARLAASELCATSAQLLGPDAVVSFSPLDSRKQQLCRQLLATLSRWRSEISSSSSLSSHANMNVRGAGGMGLGQGMFPASSGSTSYQMSPMMGTHQQQTFQGMYGSSGGPGGVIVDPNVNQMQQQYPMSMSMHMGMMPYGVPVQVPYQNNTQQQHQQLQSGQRNFDFKENDQRHNTSDDNRFRMGSDGQSVVNAGGDMGNFAAKGRERANSQGQQQQSTHGYEIQEEKSGTDGNWGGASNSNTRNVYDKSNTFQTNDATAEFTQQRQQYPAPYGTSSNMQSPHQFIQQQQQPAYRSKVQSNQIIGLQQQQYSYQQPPPSTDFYGQSHRPHHHNGGHGQQMLGPYAQGGLGGQPQQGQGQLQGRRMVKGNNPAGPHSYAGGIGGSSSNSGSTPGSVISSGRDFSQIDFSLDIGRVNEGEDLRTTVMVRNIPNKYQQQMLLEEINVGHEGTYDFFYLPIDFKNKCNVGYCFINFLDPKHIVTFVKEFNGLRWKSFNSEKVCAITFARIQGKGSMVSRFQNSSLLEKDDEYRPLLFFSSGPDRGKPEPFPSTSRSLSTHTSGGNNSMKFGSNYQPQSPNSPGSLVSVVNGTIVDGDLDGAVSLIESQLESVEIDTDREKGDAPSTVADPVSDDGDKENGVNIIEEHV
mmetsp:Transcript_26875/g.25736  ORF Transcript_26875/g.25736 Transcript_26875/m.25736 type:complete len:982 (-) Transcript_26875:339-3284(-)|eukprot:CAMPEP_0119037786 /NCGR_PEP_ID=MMETSP1177-20130426/6295_1 /TAXON_ID=2985 /ORGANISM="Ochromonas sp, Strain CCMP1899" /LENGTH=981 /DNA_ID=CAMNT_0006999475 /DNA_START=280 /DNA_END=3225 /DNA_ORIENTATION=+